MRRLILIIALWCITNVSIAATPFTTLTLAKQYCPKPTKLLFVSLNDDVTHANGFISSEKDGTVFQSNTPVVQPKTMDVDGYLKEATYQKTNKSFGYLTNRSITCFYTYPNINDTTTTLTLQGELP